MKTYNVVVRLWIRYPNQNKIPKGTLNLKVFANNQNEAIDAAMTLARGNVMGKGYVGIEHDYDLISVNEFNACATNPIQYFSKRQY